MENPVELCTRVLESFDANTKVLIGAVLAVVLNVIVLIRQLIASRSETR